MKKRIGGTAKATCTEYMVQGPAEVVRNIHRWSAFGEHEKQAAQRKLYASKWSNPE